MPSKVFGEAWPAAFDADKQALLDVALAGTRRCRLADLGGVWNVDAAYAFYAAERFDAERVALVDTEIDDRIEPLCRRDPRVVPYRDQVGNPDVLDQLGPLDAVILFDVLLHQVRPDWDAVLRLYGPQADRFVIYNPQWTGAETVRLIELGREAYFEAVPHGVDEPGYDTLFDRLDEPYEEHERLVRDVHYIWQWGITDRDLRAVMADLGFRSVHERSYGPFGSAVGFERRGFVFERDAALRTSTA